ncbi:MAG: Zn-ribbon domain-containing OB-fold protein [Terriglobales bacterium]
MTEVLKPEITDINKPYWDALMDKRLTFQSCGCGHAWLPARLACPKCLGRSWTWKEAGGTGRIKSWVVYHVAYHEAFRHKVPYNVAIVELDEGPRLFTNILADNATLAAEARVRLAVQIESGVALACFEPL